MQIFFNFKLGLISTDPLNSSLEKLNNDIKSDLLKLRTDLLLPSLNYNIDFWKNLPNEYLVLINQVLKMFSMFGTSYESSFSILKNIKSKLRSNSTDQHLEALLRINISGFEVNFDLISSN